MKLINIKQRYEVLACPTCGVSIIADPHYFNTRRKNKKCFYCINGHKQWFPGKTEDKKLREKIEECLETSTSE